MQYWGRILALTCLLVALSSSIGVGYAQDNVTIDMGALEELEGYKPPPMFGEERIQLKPFDQLQQFQIDVQTEENPKYSVAVPSPRPVAAYVPKVPPLPPRRPVIMKAPVSFVQEARQAANLEPIVVSEPVKKPEGLPPPKPHAIDITADPLTQALTEPSPQELLATIDEPKEEPQENVVAMAFGPDISKVVRKARDPEFDPDIRLVSLGFEKGAVDLNAERQRILRATALNLLRRDSNLKIQIQAFASPNDEGQSSARRLSLARAINLRSFLMDNAIDPKRIDLRALGDQTPVQPIDRVDLIILERSKVL